MIRYARLHDVPAEIVDPTEADDKSTVAVWAPRSGWILMIWPRFFNGLGDAAQWLSREFDALVSTIEVYDGDLWNHVLWRGGTELDRFSSCPNYFTGDRREIKRLKQEWAGHPQVVAEAFSIATDLVTPYLIPVASSGLFGWWLGRRKPFPDDHTTLNDIWIFTDFWQKAGITYPETDLPEIRTIQRSRPRSAAERRPRPVVIRRSRS
ncbi:hypothetical protein GCM10010112_69260 [Actinoplanes lobatus]|uniref:Uncharacterized protein n=1 Tax=Actinoplanes lobatus TaxID=113568 RepID=A0A7W7HMP3_9ACTN|nr:hypothetical protein [Actinoplanes lobatus]MBB4753097.1 hypothetical protein [Actinoplanes lobatus]GGN87053.1 hypothetical protein GCM10010112_69260 [Actinoplanes lobatus]GIE39704.1 hypothetical protein Alo02nite_26020 [Actinoplanes lobatus]